MGWYQRRLAVAEVFRTLLTPRFIQLIHKLENEFCEFNACKSLQVKLFSLITRQMSSSNFLEILFHSLIFIRLNNFFFFFSFFLTSVRFSAVFPRVKPKYWALKNNFFSKYSDVSLHVRLCWWSTFNWVGIGASERVLSFNTHTCADSTAQEPRSDTPAAKDSLSQRNYALHGLQATLNKLPPWTPSPSVPTE